MSEIAIPAAAGSGTGAEIGDLILPVDKKYVDGYNVSI